MLQFISIITNLINAPAETSKVRSFPRFAKFPMHHTTASDFRNQGVLYKIYNGACSKIYAVNLKQRCHKLNLCRLNSKLKLE